MKKTLTTHYSKTISGFTLIELLLYLTLATIMLAVLSAMGARVLESRTKAKAQEEVQYTGQFVLEHIGTALLGAEGITTPVSLATSSVLVLDMKNDDEDPTTITYENESVQIQQGAQPPYSLVGNNVAIGGLVFYNVTEGDGSHAVRIVLNVEAFNPEDQNAFAASSTFSTTMSIKP